MGMGERGKEEEWDGVWGVGGRVDVWDLGWVIVVIGLPRV